MSSHSRIVLMNLVVGLLGAFLFVGSGCTPVVPGGGGDGDNTNNTDDPDSNNDGQNGDTPDDNDEDQDTTDRRTLFVVSPNTNLLSFDDPGLLDGSSVLPSTELELGINGQLVSPNDAVVTPGGILIVANAAGVSFFENAFTASGPRPANRILEGLDSGINSPVDVAYDPVNDVLFVSENVNSDEIFVFDDVSNVVFEGDPRPDRTIGTDDNSFDAEQMRFFDGALYVVSRDDILIFENASTLDTLDFVADRILSSPLIDEPGISIDPNGRLVVTNSDDTVRIWNDAASVDGSPAPDLELTIQGASRIDSAVIDSNDRLYAADRDLNQIYSIAEVSQLESGEVVSGFINEADTLQTPERLFLFESE